MCRRLDWVVMSQLGEDKLLSLLTEIHSDIRQIKYDLQSLLTLLKQQEQKSTPHPPSDSDDTNSVESAQSGSAHRRPSLSARDARQR